MATEMYHVKPLMEEWNVEPEVGMYRVEPIHPHLRKDASAAAAATPANHHSSPTAAAAKAPKSKQQKPSAGDGQQQDALATRIKHFITRVDQFCADFKSKVNVSEHGHKRQHSKARDEDEKSPKKQKTADDKSPSKQQKKAADEKSPNKKQQQKAEKKEKAAAKQQAKPSTAAPKQQASKSAGGKAPTTSAAAEPQITLPPRKSTASVTFHGLNATVDPFGYKMPHDKFAVQLKCRPADKKWLAAITQLAKKRDVDVSEKPNGDRTIQVECTDTGEIQLSGAPLLSRPITGHIAVWKTLASLLGLYDATDAPLIASTDLWLRFASDILIGRMDVDSAVRVACHRLSAHDYLADSKVATFVDFILNSLLADAAYLPNNVELWSKRLVLAA